ncbi:SRPBCC domain-containing protein [uncultured Ruegeria sp.]|uniref:SRPBCC domain-containing protein n=1 Tax=uncultured Ruegeria sp. TaxID=259304 RepID=UPI0026270BD2|nr:SRPBCC domain-containing protein [uncultured Ruegeria sp.]
MANVIKKSATLRCSPNDAFRAFVEKVDLWWPQGHRKFEGSTLRFEARVGGRFFEDHPTDGLFVLGEVLELTPPKALRFTWHPGKLSAPTEVSVRFVADGDTTQVLIDHSEGSAAMGERWPERAALFVAGWTRVLADLDVYILSSTQGQ